MTSSKASLSPKPNTYLDGESQLIGSLEFDMEIPKVPVDFQFLRQYVNPMALCQYRPTPLEMSAASSIMADLVETSLVSTLLLDSIESSPIGETDGGGGEARPLHPEDANLISGIVDVTSTPLDEPTVTPDPVTTPSSQHVTSGSLQIPSAVTPLSVASRAERIRQQFVPPAFVHPTKPHLKVKKVLPLLPNEEKWASRLLIGAMEGHDADATQETLMRRIRSTTNAEKRFALYEGLKGGDVERLGHHRDFLISGGMRGDANAAAAAGMPPPSHQGTERHFYVELKDDSAHVLRLVEKKVFFQKASASTGRPDPRRAPIDLTWREPTQEEQEEAAELRRIFAPTAFDTGAQRSRDVSRSPTKRKLRREVSSSPSASESPDASDEDRQEQGAVKQRRLRKVLSDGEGDD